MKLSWYLIFEWEEIIKALEWEEGSFMNEIIQNQKEFYNLSIINVKIMKYDTGKGYYKTASNKNRNPYVPR